MRKKRLLNRSKLIFKITQTDKNRRIITDQTRMIALTHKARRGRSESPFVANRNRRRSNNYSGTVGFEAKPD